MKTKPLIKPFTQFAQFVALIIFCESTFMKFVSNINILKSKSKTYAPNMKASPELRK